MFRKLTKLLFWATLILGGGWLLTSSWTIKGVDKLEDLPAYGTFPKASEYPPIIKLARNDDPFCTAFVIDANYALTAGHCVSHNGALDKEKVQIFLADDTDTEVEGTPAAVNNRMDVGLIKGDFNKFHFLLVNFYSFSIATERTFYLSCGFPYGQKHLTCVPFVPTHNHEFDIAGHGFLVPGMSGGPLIDLKNRIVVGINVSVGEGSVNEASVIGALGAFGIEPDEDEAENPTTPPQKPPTPAPPQK